MKAFLIGGKYNNKQSGMDVAQIAESPLMIYSPRLGINLYINPQNVFLTENI